MINVIKSVYWLTYLPRGTWAGQVGPGLVGSESAFAVHKASFKQIDFLPESA